VSLIGQRSYLGHEYCFYCQRARAASDKPQEVIVEYDKTATRIPETCKHGRVKKNCDVVGCEHYPVKFVCTNLPEVKFSPDYYHQMHGDAILLIMQMRDGFLLYYYDHKRKELGAETTKLRQQARTKADVNWEQAQKCQRFIDMYQVPPEVNNA